MRQVTKGRRRARAEARRGMTLIELMVAMVLLGVGMLGLAGLSLTVGRQFGTGARQADAALVASMVHFMGYTCEGIKREMHAAGVKVRMGW